METTIVRYKVKTDRAEENLRSTFVRSSLPETSALKALIENIKDRCDEPPTATASLCGSL